MGPVAAASARNESSRDRDFRALFDEHAAAMVQLAYRIVHNDAEAEEVVQDAYVELYQRWPKVMNPSGYLRVAVVNRARRVVRRRLHRDELHQRIGVNVPDTEHRYLLDLLIALPERERTALVLAYYGDFTRAEIADTLGCPEGTAKSLVHRGLRRLEKELRRE